jgi:hypothetical protein
VAVPLLTVELAPRVRVEAGQLLVRDPEDRDVWLPVDAVIFHGIFEDDLPLLTALALWGGPCLPDALGLLDLRPRIAGLARSLRVTRFGNPPRGYANPGDVVRSDSPAVVKFGEWHCGEGKERFTGEFRCSEPTLVEPFLEGQAVRVQLIGDRAWQMRLGGEGWKKSIHGDDTAFVEPDPELVADTRQLADHFRMSILGVDYIARTGSGYSLLEVNHVPNVTHFPEIRSAFLDLAAAWIGQLES